VGVGLQFLGGRAKLEPDVEVEVAADANSCFVRIATLAAPAVIAPPFANVFSDTPIFFPSFSLESPAFLNDRSKLDASLNRLRSKLTGSQLAAEVETSIAPLRQEVEETFVAHAIDTPKSVASERTILLGPVAAEALYARYTDTAYRDDTERVFCHPQTGGALDRKRYADTLRTALALAGIEGRVRPFHDGRHTAITNAAAAGVPPAALQAGAGRGTPTCRRRSATSTSRASASAPRRNSPRAACSVPLSLVRS
jgi:hypothetical protein